MSRKNIDKPSVEGYGFRTHIKGSVILFHITVFLCFQLFIADGMVGSILLEIQSKMPPIIVSVLVLKISPFFIHISIAPLGIKDTKASVMRSNMLFFPLMLL
jgi:hypothetical protein